MDSFHFLLRLWFGDVDWMYEIWVAFICCTTCIICSISICLCLIHIICICLLLFSSHSSFVLSHAARVPQEVLRDGVEFLPGRSRPLESPLHAQPA